MTHHVPRTLSSTSNNTNTSVQVSEMWNEFVWGLWGNLQYPIDTSREAKLQRNKQATFKVMEAHPFARDINYHRSFSDAERVTLGLAS